MESVSGGLTLGTAEYALIISITSLLLAFCSLIWNVWSKFIFPKPAISFGCNLITSIDFPSPIPIEEAPFAIAVSATNL